MGVGELRPGPAVVHPPAELVPGSLGLMGGTFDPIHVGHLAIAEEVREVLGLERVWFIPAGQPPHRAAAATSDDRLAMVRAAIAGSPAFELSRVEVDRPGPSFTVDTVEELAAERRGTDQPTADPARATRGKVIDAGGQTAAAAGEMIFVMSAETLAELPGWREPRRLLEACRIAVVPRAGYPPPERSWVETTFPGLADRVILLDGPRLGISSSAIRARVAAGRSIRYLVPPAVAEIIERRRLYLDR